MLLSQVRAILTFTGQACIDVENKVKQTSAEKKTRSFDDISQVTMIEINNYCYCPHSTTCQAIMYADLSSSGLI